jgi:hypothetical protein
MAQGGRDLDAAPHAAKGEQLALRLGDVVDAFEGVCVAVRIRPLVRAASCVATRAFRAACAPTLVSNAPGKIKLRATEEKPTRARNDPGEVEVENVASPLANCEQIYPHAIFWSKHGRSSGDEITKRCAPTVAHEHVSGPDNSWVAAPLGRQHFWKFHISAAPHAVCSRLDYVFFNAPRRPIPAVVLQREAHEPTNRYPAQVGGRSRRVGRPAKGGGISRACGVAKTRFLLDSCSIC